MQKSNGKQVGGRGTAAAVDEKREIGARVAAVGSGLSRAAGPGGKKSPHARGSAKGAVAAIDAGAAAVVSTSRTAAASSTAASSPVQYVY